MNNENQVDEFLKTIENPVQKRMIEQIMLGSEQVECDGFIGLDDMYDWCNAIAALRRLANRLELTLKDTWPDYEGYLKAAMIDWPESDEPLNS